MHCWRCETPLELAFWPFVYCPNAQCQGLRWTDDDDDKGDDRGPLKPAGPRGGTLESV